MHSDVVGVQLRDDGRQFDIVYCGDGHEVGVPH